MQGRRTPSATRGPHRRRRQRGLLRRGMGQQVLQGKAHLLHFHLYRAGNERVAAKYVCQLSPRDAHPLKALGR